MSSSPFNADEIVIQGVPAASGIAVGKAYVHKKVMPIIDAKRIDEEMVPVQLKLFQNAQKNLSNHWELLLQKEASKVSKAILTAQIEIISDPELTNQVEDLIKTEYHTAQQAIHKAFNKYIDLLAETGSNVMRDRMIDLTDIRDRLIETATGEENVLQTKQGDILIAREISPREVIQLSHQNVKGFVMEQGGHTSHAAIMARSMGIPAVVGAKGVIDKVKGNTSVYINGENGRVAINPADEKWEEAQKWEAERPGALERKVTLCKKPSCTADGQDFTIRANIEFPEELENARRFCAKGIGLLRTESKYMDQEEFGTIEEQVEFYENIAAETEDYPVVIRLFDVGGDKFQGAEVKENNPFLGWRGIRMLLDQRELLHRQLKAILKVANRYPGKIKILVPMVSVMDEITAVKEEIEKCRREMKEEGHTVDAEIPVGMMVEIPSAALQASYFAPKVDFLSIGTNDLTQYLLAVDRGNALISELYDQNHPAAWKVINHVIEVAQKHDTEVEVCGELASYPVAAACLVGMGARSLSMSPVSIPAVKKILRQNYLDEMQELAEKVLECEELEEVKSLFNNWQNNLTHV